MRVMFLWTGQSDDMMGKPGLESTGIKSLGSDEVQDFETEDVGWRTSVLPEDLE